MAERTRDPGAPVRSIPMKRQKGRAPDGERAVDGDSLSGLPLDALRRLGSDILNEPVPDRHLDALRGKRMAIDRSVRKH